MLIGLFLFGAMSALCSFANTSGQLIAFRALMGIGAAAIQPQTLSIIQNVFEPRERPKAIGIWAGASGAGIALGPIAGGLLLKYFWWGSIFLVNVPIVIIAIVAIFLLVPDSKDPKPGKLDPLGVLLSIVSLFVLVYGVIQGGNKNEWLRWDTGGAIVLGIVLLALFVYVQHRSSHPTIDVSLFRNRSFSSGAFAISMAFFALQGSTFFLAYYLQAVRDYSPLHAGFALIAVAVAVMTAAPLSARLSTRFGPAAVVGFGLGTLGVTLCLYGLATAYMPVVAVELLLVGTGGGIGLTMSPATNAIMSAVPREKAGAGSAVNNTVRQVAGALGVAVLGSILAVSFRAHLGSDTPHQLAAKLDGPAAVSRQLPASQRVTPFATDDTSQSIADAELYAGQAQQVVGTRYPSKIVKASTDPKLRSKLSTSEQGSEAKLTATLAPIGGFVAEAKSSFISAMNITAVLGGIMALLGALVAWRFLPNRKQFAEQGSPRDVTVGTVERDVQAPGRRGRPGARARRPCRRARPRQQLDRARRPPRAGRRVRRAGDRRGRPMNAVAAKRGRPRNETLDTEILDAAVDELIDHGFSGLTIEGVAQRAGVAKTTIYRRWSDTSDLALAATRAIKYDAIQPPPGSVHDQLVWLVERLRLQWSDPRWSAVMRRVAADGTVHPKVYAEHRDRLVSPHLDVMRDVLERGAAEGSIRADVELEGLRRLIVAPVIAASMTLRPVIGPNEARSMLELVLRGAAP